jgi:hypothetical protein
VFGYLPTGFGAPFWVTIPFGLVAVVLPVYLFGRRSRRPDEPVPPPRFHLHHQKA